MASHHNQTFMRLAGNKGDLQKRLEESGWGFFLLMIGTLMLLPSELVPPGTWLIGTGLLMLTLNFIRYLNNIAVSGFTIILGAIAVALGLMGLFGLRLPLFPALLALIGLSIIVKSMLPATNKFIRNR